MQYAVALLAFVATVSAQTATGTPPSCSTDFPQTFEISPVNVSSSAPKARDLIAERGYACSDIPYIMLKGGVLTDQDQRTGEVVANRQFQFDSPLQAGRIFTAGFSVCQNNTLALGSSAIFYACKSGNFSNFYDQTQGEQCYQIYLAVLPCDSVAGSSSSPSISAPTSSAISAAISTATSATPAPSTPATTSATSIAPTTPVTTSSLAGPAIPSVAPFPKGNSTTPAGTASATAPGRATTSATTSALTAPASGASATIVGSTFGLVAAALVAFAMF